jgi:hypothetical protein
MFKGMSQCMLTVGVLYFSQFIPFHYSPLPLYLSPPIFLQLSIHILTSSTITSYVMRYYWCSITLFSFPTFPKFHRVVPLHNEPSYKRATIDLSLIKWHLSCFHDFAIMKKLFKHSCAGLCLDISLLFIWVNTKEQHCVTVVRIYLTY